MIVEDGAYKDLMEFPNVEPPRPVLQLSGYEAPAKPRPAPDYMQFSLPGCAPKFGDVSQKKTSHRRKVTPAQGALFAPAAFHPLPKVTPAQITVKPFLPDVHGKELIFRNFAHFAAWNATLTPDQRLAFRAYAVRFTERETAETVVNIYR